MYVRSAIYAVEGSIVFIANTFFFVAIFRFRSLRNKYIVILEQIASDAVSSLGITVAGIGRTIVMLLDIEELKSRRYCMLMPWNILFLWGETLTPVAMLTVSVDRLISVLFPLNYFKCSRSTQIFEVSVGCCVVAALSIENWILTFPETDQKFSPVCLTSSSWQPFHDHVFFALKVFASSSSVLVYFFVFLIARKYSVRAKSLQRGQVALDAFQKRQRQLTITMGISCAFTLIVYVLPTCVKYAFQYSDDADFVEFISIYSAISSYMNPLVNLTILFIRQLDIRDAVRKSRPITWRNGARVSVSTPNAANS
ncbi:unnamed protein product [Toxocara canis]|uniref:G_PROTEIN_RECEP_F1_2 domain-containing protein n=1 Tax=Toxocara canis TaxID=6265 RepID=A0A183UUJ6_TOXCA|nr:unnamed protein product [Toxocara canis]